MLFVVYYHLALIIIIFKYYTIKGIYINQLIVISNLIIIRLLKRNLNIFLRSRIPFHEAKIKELYEEGLSGSGKLLDQLITFEKSIKVPEGLIVPKLYNDYKLIDEIVSYLKQSEINYVAGW